jgi:hypothetical protein
MLPSLAMVASGEKARRTHKMRSLIGQPYFFYIFFLEIDQSVRTHNLPHQVMRSYGFFS